MITFFSKGLARVQTQQLFRLSALHQYRWDAYDASLPPITKEEIDFALARNECIPPGVYEDEPHHDQMDNFLDCSRKSHIGRIAWFVKNYDPKLDSPTSLTMTEYSACCLSGNHRLAAKLYLGLDDIKCEFNVGQVSFIERFFNQIDWLNKPSTDHFGYNLIVENDREWEIEAHTSPLKVYINSRNGCNLQLSADRRGVSARVSNGDMVECPVTKLLYGPDISINDVIEACSSVISPVFGCDEFRLYVEENFFSKLTQLNDNRISSTNKMKA